MKTIYCNDDDERGKWNGNWEGIDYFFAWAGAGVFVLCIFLGIYLIKSIG